MSTTDAAGRQWVAVPAKGYRVARCTRCEKGFTWKHADPIGCPDCGTASLTTSTRQRRAGFFEVTGDELTAARIIGLRQQAQHERGFANWSFEQAGRLIMDPEWTAEDDGGQVKNGYMGMNTVRLIAGATRRQDKAAKLERKAAKLERS